LLWSAPAAGTEPATGSSAVVSALELAPYAVVVVFEEPRALDGEAYLAVARVEQTLMGRTHERVEVVWEERARSRPVRFAAGDRVLLALEPLPGHSIWRQRIPDAEQRARSLYVALEGGAFVRQPSTGALLELEHFLRLPPDLREKDVGVGYLAALAEGAELPLAVSALERLAAVPDLDGRLDAGAAAGLVGALLRPDGDGELRERALALVGQGPLRALRPTLIVLAAREPLAPASVFDALGRIDGALPNEQALRLLGARDSADHRRAGARYASGDAVQRLPAVLRSDPAAPVRAAAAVRWLEVEGVRGADRVSPALRDSDPAVRNGTLMALAKLGPDAVPVLRAAIETAPPEVARSAVAALQVAGGPASVTLLRQLAESHPDEGVRMLAGAALGRGIGHTD
jgi:HEAT repeat protein